MKFTFSRQNIETCVCLLDNTPYDKDSFEYYKIDLIVRCNHISPKYTAFTVLRCPDSRQEFPMNNTVDQAKFMILCTKFIKRKKKLTNSFNNWNKRDEHSSYDLYRNIKESKRYKNH
jgi:hypothetical protein